MQDEHFVILASHLCPLNWMVEQCTFEFAFVFIMWKTSWLHVAKKISKASWPWLLNLDWNPHWKWDSKDPCVEFSYNLTKFWLLWHWKIHFVSLMWSLRRTYHGVKFSLAKPKPLFTFQVKGLIMHWTTKHNICICLCDILWITKFMCNFWSQLGLIWSCSF